MILPMLSHQFTFRIDYQPFEIRRLNHVEIFQLPTLVRISRPEALIDSDRVDNRLRDIEFGQAIALHLDSRLLAESKSPQKDSALDAYENLHHAETLP